MTDFKSSKGPIVQVCIDVFTLEEAIEVGHRAQRAKADWLEVGTPLILFNGIQAVGQFFGGTQSCEPCLLPVDYRVLAADRSASIASNTAPQPARKLLRKC